MSFPESVLPSHMQRSRLDIVLIQGCSRANNAISMQDGRLPSAVLYLVEVTVTSDFRVHDAVRTKTDQHEPLLQSLQAYGWRNARLHVLVVTRHENNKCSHAARLGSTKSNGTPSPKLQCKLYTGLVAC